MLTVVVVCAWVAIEVAFRLSIVLAALLAGREAAVSPEPPVQPGLPYPAELQRQLEAQFSQQITQTFYYGTNEVPREFSGFIPIGELRYVGAMEAQIAQATAQMQFAGLDFLSERNNKSTEKSIALLKEWLTPAQWVQYDMTGMFDAFGSSTGKRYRIGRGNEPYNVAEMNPTVFGETVTHKLCFVPTGADYEGDVMLAQKIMLEQDEPEAIRIANRIVVYRP